MSNIIIDVALGTSAAEFQAMIEDAAGGAAFRLQAGTYVFDAPIHIGASDISVFGAGSGQTIIQLTSDLGGAPAFQVGHDLHQPTILSQSLLAAPAMAGNHQVVMQSGHGLSAGDYVYFTQDNTDAWLDSIGDTDWRQDKDLRTIAAQVTDVQGDVVTIDRNLTFDFDPVTTVVETREYLTGNELAGFSIVGPYGTADPSQFSNAFAYGFSHSMVLLAGTSGARVFDLGIHDAISHGLTVADSIDVQVKSLVVNGAHNKGGGGNGYGLWIRDSYNGVFDDLTLTDTRHGVTFASYTSASGNDVQVSHTNRDVNFHGGRDQFNTVVVDNMLRFGAEQDYLSAASYVNPGEAWGAPTDATQNELYFRNLVASNLDDVVLAHKDGSNLSLLGGNDFAASGQGDDFIFAGDGDDMVLASGGRDMFDGGAGQDMVVFAENFADLSLQILGADIVFQSANGAVTTVTGFEIFHFADGQLDIAALVPGAVPTPAPAVSLPAGLPALSAVTPGYTVDRLVEDPGFVGKLGKPVAPYFEQVEGDAPNLVSDPAPIAAPDAAPLLAPVQVVSPASPVVPAGPDLTISDAWLDDSTLADGDRTKLRLVVQNLGDEDAKGESTFYWSADDVFDAGDIAFGLDSHSTLSAGEADTNERLSIDYADLALYGDGFIFAYIDAYDTVAESNEGNNLSAGLYIDLI